MIRVMGSQPCFDPLPSKHRTSSYSGKDAVVARSMDVKVQRLLIVARCLDRLLKNMSKQLR
jgi:hypothetical protein